MSALLSRYHGHKAKDVPWCAKIAKSLGLELDDKTMVAEVVAASWAFHAAKGQSAYLKESLDRLEGPVTQKHEVSGPMSGPLRILWDKSDEELDEIIKAADEGDAGDADDD